MKIFFSRQRQGINLKFTQKFLYTSEDWVPPNKIEKLFKATEGNKFAAVLISLLCLFLVLILISLLYFVDRLTHQQLEQEIKLIFLLGKQNFNIIQLQHQME